MIGLHSIHPGPRSKKTRTRIGRGNGSGIGTYSGGGIKGQRARSGGKSGLTARAMKPYLLRIPKSRGFASDAVPFSVVNVGVLQTIFNDGERVTPKILRSRGLIMHSSDRVKILGGGELSKRLIVSAHGFSQEASDAIVKAGGSVKLLTGSQKKRTPEKK